jgi:uncharacterized low-complexity protein
MKKFSKQPIALALGAAFALGGMAVQASVFQAADLGTGYMVAGDMKDAKGAEVKCGADCIKAKSDGGMKEADAKAACDKMAKEGKCGGDHAADKKKDGKCGEGKCGAKK